MKELPVAYAYDLGLHCISCTVKRFSVRPGGHCDANGVEIDTKDSHGYYKIPYYGNKSENNCKTCDKSF